MMRMILLGAPGSGKGTQAGVIKERFGIPHISTGDIIRETLKSGSELGKKAGELVNAGKLLPDDIVIGMVAAKLAGDSCKNGFILDGFPRTIPQAEALDTLGIQLDVVLNIEVPDESILERLSGRRTCSDCGNVYHIVYNRPVKEDCCDKCGGTLIQRKDDQTETILNRLKVFHEQTEPLIDFYEKKNLVKTVKGQEKVEETTRLVLEALQ